ncbi:hypothetical protein GCM10010104_41770 [Streptomyces indiaensis]|uniref:Uncharacterized protein n=1 Tax=Streptomyces indiaensis TaxID=284033 RepID=A0ABN3DUM7_9ACTN
MAGSRRSDVGLAAETGILVIGRLDHGPADDLTLPRPGVYEGHAWGQGRQAAADYDDTTLDQLTDDL